MTVAQVPETNNGVVAPVPLTKLQMRVAKAEAEFNAEADKVWATKRRIVNATEKLVTLAVYAGQKREKWLMLLALQEQAEAAATS